MVYSKPLGGKSRIVKLVREMKKKIGSFTWAVLYIYSVYYMFYIDFGRPLSSELLKILNSNFQHFLVVGRQPNAWSLNILGAQVSKLVFSG